MWWIIVMTVATAVCYKIIFRPYKYWIDKGVQQSSPVFPFGDNWKTVFQRQSYLDFIQMIYNMYPKARYSGFYQFTTPTLLIRDLDLVKQITVKDFDHFTDHRSLLPENVDPLWGKNLFSLKGEKWREIRANLSPAFTSSKMKNMFSLLAQNGEQFVKHFLKGKGDIVTVEMKDIFTRFTNDVIASVAFGVECDSLEEKDNQFYLMGKEATEMSGFWQRIKVFGFYLIPKLWKLLGVTLFSKEVSKFFNGVIKTNIECRQKHQIVRPDMINLLLEARKNSLQYEESSSAKDTGFATVEESEIGKNQNIVKKEITDEDITYQAFIFFFAGFDSVSSLMCFMSYELGANPNVQEKLRKEVDDTLKACNGKITYEALLSMKYMDMVVCETLRMWPNTIAIDRICTKPYTIQPKNPEEKAVHLKENDVVWIPMWAFQRDPKYFPDPDSFDPERFNEKNKSKIKPYSYLPFGSGPRNCIGSRFALLETKILFFYILSHFEIVPVEKTQIPLIISKKALTLTSEGGFWFGLKRRIK